MNGLFRLPDVRETGGGDSPVLQTKALVAGMSDLGAAELWAIDLDADHPPVSYSPDERGRAARYRFDVDRRRFLAGRAALRIILAGRLGAEIDRVALRDVPMKRPELLLDDAAATLSWSYSRSGGLALVCLADDGTLGVDVEERRMTPEAGLVAGRHFAPAERNWLAGLSDAERTEGFLRLWTAKEAIAKALGLGLSADLPAIEVEIAELDGKTPTEIGEPRIVSATSASAGLLPPEGGNWRILSLLLAPTPDARGLEFRGHVAAVACAQAPVRLK